MTFDLAQNKSIQISFVRGGTIHALCQLLRMAPREKILRLTLAILANLSQTQTPNQTTYLGEMIAAKAHKYLQQIRQDRPNSTFMSDPDFMDDLETLQTVLNHYAKKMTQWNVYQAELDSGQLQWGMLHTSDFFQRHVHHLEGPKGDFEPIKKLIGILLQNLNTLSEDTDTTLAVCLFDIGEFLRHYPNGRVIAKSLGIREIVLQLLNHPNEEIQKHALLCVSKLLLQNYHSNIIERDR
jgi:V-type H+-transporting ATPase subunit H